MLLFFYHLIFMSAFTNGNEVFSSTTVLKPEAIHVTFRNECKQGLNVIDVIVSNTTSDAQTQIQCQLDIPGFIQMAAMKGRIEYAGVSKLWTISELAAGDSVLLQIWTYPFAPDSQDSIVVTELSHGLSSSASTVKFRPDCTLGIASAEHFSATKQGDQLSIVVTSFSGFRANFALLDKQGRVLHEFKHESNKSFTVIKMPLEPKCTGAAYLVGQSFGEAVEITEINN